MASEEKDTLQGFFDMMKSLPKEFWDDIEKNAELYRSYRDNPPEGLLERLKGHLKDNHGSLDIGQAEKLPVKSLPDNHVIANNKLANSLTNENAVGTFDITVAETKKGEKIQNRCIITYEGGEAVTIKGRRPFTEYDRQVHDAVVSLFLNDNKKFTPAMVYRAMSGDFDADKISQTQLDAITDSLNKMRFLNVDVDMSKELEFRHITLDEDTTITSVRWKKYLLNMDAIEIEFENATGKHKTSGFRLNDTPVLYAYSMLTKQILTVKTELLAIKDKNGKTLNNNEARITIKGYLMRRVLVMKGKTQQSNRILLQNIYELFPETSDRMKLKRYKDYAIAVLESWTNDGFIAGYLLVGKKGQPNYAVDIQL